MTAYTLHEFIKHLYVIFMCVIRDVYRYVIRRLYRATSSCLFKNFLNIAVYYQLKTGRILFIFLSRRASFAIPFHASENTFFVQLMRAHDCQLKLRRG